MSLVWCICGAGRGVGKTTLAMRLCEVLPKSVYAKCGHGRPHAHKPARFFSTLQDLLRFIESARKTHRHVVVESNALAKGEEAEIVVFIDAVPDRTDPRKDADLLRRRATIVIDKDARADDWSLALSRHLRSRSLAGRVTQVLTEQRHYHWGSTPQVRLRL